MDRIKVAKELVKIAKELMANVIRYKGYTIEKSGFNFYVKDPSGHRAFGEVPATIETAKKWIDWDVYEKRGKQAKELTAGMLEIVIPSDIVGKDKKVFKGNNHEVLKHLERMGTGHQLVEVWDGNQLVCSGTSFACMDGVEEYRA